jgi:hypothetical protein
MMAMRLRTPTGQSRFEALVAEERGVTEALLAAMIRTLRTDRTLT